MTSIAYNLKAASLFGGNASLVLGRLEYRFTRYKNGFWKFFEPCEKHKAYKEGDSWKEEVGLSRKAFRFAFSKIGEIYQSKEAFDKEADPFKGKLYASYYNRKTNKTYYVRNHALVEEFKTNFFSGKAVDKHVDKSVDKTEEGTFQERHLGTVSYLKKDNTKDTTPIPRVREQVAEVPSPDALPQSPREGGKDYKKMFNLWIDVVEKDIPPQEATVLTLWRCRELRERFSDTFKSDLEVWKSFCERISVNSFLMGSGERGWKISLDWALKRENIEKVLTDGYFSGQKQTTKEEEMSQPQEQPVTENEIQGTELYKKFGVNLARVIGPASYRSWFKANDVTPVGFDEHHSVFTLEFKSNFWKDTVATRFKSAIEAVLKQSLGGKKISFEVRR